MNINLTLPRYTWRDHGHLYKRYLKLEDYYTRRRKSLQREEEQKEG